MVNRTPYVPRPLNISDDAVEAVRQNMLLIYEAALTNHLQTQYGLSTPETAAHFLDDGPQMPNVVAGAYADIINGALKAMGAPRTVDAATCNRDGSKTSRVCLDNGPCNPLNTPDWVDERPPLPTIEAFAEALQTFDPRSVMIYRLANLIQHPNGQRALIEPFDPKLVGDILATYRAPLGQRRN